MFRTAIRSVASSSRSLLQRPAPNWHSTTAGFSIQRRANHTNASTTCTAEALAKRQQRREALELSSYISGRDLEYGHPGDDPSKFAPSLLDELDSLTLRHDVSHLLKTPYLSLAPDVLLEGELQAFKGKFLYDFHDSSCRPFVSLPVRIRSPDTYKDFPGYSQTGILPIDHHKAILPRWVHFLVHPLATHNYLSREVIEAFQVRPLPIPTGPRSHNYVTCYIASHRTRACMSTPGSDFAEINILGTHFLEEFCREMSFSYQKNLFEMSVLDIRK